MRLSKAVPNKPKNSKIASDALLYYNIGKRRDNVRGSVVLNNKTTSVLHICCSNQTF